MKRFIIKGFRLFNRVMNFLTPIGDLFLRLWVARVFFASGLTKIQSWHNTLFLFTYEYHVPGLPPYIAAVLGTSIELVLPIFIILGLGGRLPAFILFIFNIIAVVSYPFLWTEMGIVGLKDHITWGMILMVLMLHGSGKLALDGLLTRYSPAKS